MAARMMGARGRRTVGPFSVFGFGSVLGLLAMAVAVLPATAAGASPVAPASPTARASIAGPAAVAADPPVWPAPGVVSRSIDSGAGHPTKGPRVVALTFDDGPHPTRTPVILDILKAKGVKATFFITSGGARTHPSLVKRMVAEGHVVASHSIDHSNLATLSAAGQYRQVFQSADDIDAIIGAGSVRCIRPPYGSYNSTTVAAARARGLAVAIWSRDTNDWRGRSVGEIVAAGASDRYDGGRGVVLLHDTVARNAQAVPVLIDTLRSRGYSFVTMCGAPKAKPTPPPLPVPVHVEVPDLDGDGSDDAFWYGPGSTPDSSWHWNGAAFGSVARPISGTYVPVPGDFDGNGTDDVFWYAPGTAPDSFWFTDHDGKVTSKAASITGRYTPIVGNFDDDAADEIFWYAEGAPLDSVWHYDPGTASVRSTSLDVRGAFTPVVGDFDGDGTDDLYWYAPGAAADHLWLGGAGGFRNLDLSLFGAFTPVVGDFDGDGADDLFLYAPGSAPDHLWTFDAATDRFVSRDLGISGRYQPLVGDFDGDGAHDIFWYAPGNDLDSIWYGGAAFPRNVTFQVFGSYTPVVADVDGAAHAVARPATSEEIEDPEAPEEDPVVVTDDILWYGPGGRADALWRGTPGGFDTATPISVHGTYQIVGAP